MRINDTMPENLHRQGNWYQGRPIQTKHLLGNPTLIVFWSVSCNSCLVAIRQLSRLQSKYNDAQILFIHTPLMEEDNNLNLIRNKSSQFNVHGSKIADRDESLSKLFQVKYVPAFYLFDQQGKLRYIQSGKSNTSLLDNKLARLYRK
ncbi:TlpA family protein disulfide reductase [Oceanobacillus iheyensis]|uniref:Hypothetical conserved protein n=1 Tax=Oceanobacillus iheyensis (strain DSM 14371 / CIP 107618 / JCM 11309 / KCTC 3954 / HTE831) TaxID=221109 RepID=Q8ERA2_OCEIH|nr:TlpA disulfide reductase family protein [Oceanobacillus iheyensis]BAC13360.1 hypothetical conserved protein [Oceanobacillus iheyensis HTE831]